MRLVWLAGAVAVTGALSGCGVGWPISKSEIGSPQPSAARLVVYRPSGVMLPWRSVGIDVNGVAACDLSRGTGLDRDVAGGEVAVVAHVYGIEGKSSLSWTAETGRIYYVRVRIRGETTPGAMGGLVGLGSNWDPGPGGPFELALTDEAEAIASGVKLAPCPADR